MLINTLVISLCLICRFYFGLLVYVVFCIRQLFIPFRQVTMFLCCATILAIIQYCNFCQLSFWMRSVLATATGVALLLLLYSPLHR